ncbi:MAG TPA: VOC family protein [Thermoplasmata archaeon]|nr:VOC family protein [Thermoplasmata archaeon]
MRAKGLEHVTVSVSDLDRSLLFYHRLLGIPMLGRGEEQGPAMSGPTGTTRRPFLYADLELGGGQILELLQYLTPTKGPVRTNGFAPGNSRIGIRVGDMEVALRRLRQAGVRTMFDPVRVAGPASRAGARVVHVSDPDGTSVELVERPRTSLRPLSHGPTGGNKRLEGRT